MIILASQSKIRSQLLSSAGISHQTTPANIDEAHLQQQHAMLSPKHLAETLAKFKALSVSAQTPDAIVIGADQTLEFEGRCLHKSATLEHAHLILSQLRDKTHFLHSAISVTKGNDVLFQHVETAELTMRNFTTIELERYLAETGNQILTTVGCYHLEGRGVQLFSAIKGDYFTILGLPLLPLITCLREIGELPS